MRSVTINIIYGTTHSVKDFIMSKQEDFVRTQIRLEKHTHSLLKEFCEANKVSMNEAMNSLIFSSLMNELVEDNFTKRENLINMATNNLNDFTLQEVRDVCAIIGYIGHLRS